MPKTNRHDIDPSWCLHIHMWMMTELGLSGAERDVYAAVYGFTFEGGWKQIEWSFLAAFTGCSMATVRRAADALIKRGLLEKSAIVTKFGPRNQFRAIRPRPVENHVENHVENPVENEARESAPARNEHAPLPKTSTPPARNEQAYVNKDINVYINDDVREDYELYNWPDEPEEGWDSVGPVRAWVSFRRMHPKPVPVDQAVEARRAFDAYVEAHGFRRVVEQLAAYLEAEHAKGTARRYLKNAAAWVLDGWMEKDYAAASPAARKAAGKRAVERARAAQDAPEAIECPVCGARAARGDYGLYHCSCCDTDIKPSWA